MLIGVFSLAILSGFSSQAMKLDQIHAQVKIQYADNKKINFGSAACEVLNLGKNNIVDTMALDEKTGNIAVVTYSNPPSRRFLKIIKPDGNIQRVGEHDYGIGKLIFIDGGKQLVSEDGEIIVWDLVCGKGIIKGKNYSHISYNNIHDVFACIKNGIMCIADIKKNKSTKLAIEQNNIKWVYSAYSPDGRKLAITGERMIADKLRFYLHVFQEGSLIFNDTIESNAGPNEDAYLVREPVWSSCGEKVAFAYFKADERDHNDAYYLKTWDVKLRKLIRTFEMPSVSYLSHYLWIPQSSSLVLSIDDFECRQLFVYVDIITGEIARQKWYYHEGPCEFIRSFIWHDNKLLVSIVNYPVIIKTCPPKDVILHLLKTKLVTGLQINMQACQKNDQFTDVEIVS